MKPSPGPDQDPYSRVQYRRHVAWPQRILRESPRLERWIAGLPVPRVLDLGCGTGEHCRYLAAQGLVVAGIDLSPGMLVQAAESSRDIPGLHFVRAAMHRLPLSSGTFGGAICLGNSLVHLAEPGDLRLFFQDMGRVLVPGGRLLLQILNYRRLVEKGIRWLPLNFTEDGESELVFLRLMRFGPDRRVDFCPTTLRFDPDAEAPVEVMQSRRVRLHAWTREDLEPAAGEFGFATVSVAGDMTDGDFDPLESQDLVLELVRR